MSKTSNLPAEISNLAQSVRSSQVAVQSADPSASGAQYLKFVKGEWVYGAEEIEVTEDAMFAVNPRGLAHGWTNWDDDNVNHGEEMVLASQAIPARASLPEAPGRWTPQVAMQLVGLGGDDDGVELIFKTNSKGGKDASQKFCAELIERIESGNPDFVPIVQLSADSYKHKKYGKVYTPVLTIVDWTDEQGGAPDPEAEIEEEEPVKAPRTRKRGRR